MSTRCKGYRLIGTLLLLLPFTEVLAQIAERQYNPWEQSLNPAGICYTPIDSVIEVMAGYNLTRTPLALSNQPEKDQHYGASVDGYRRIGKLQLSGGLSWEQSRLEGHAWNFLTQPDYLVTAGDTLGEPQRTEQYQIYGKAACALTNHLTGGLSGMYTATDNRNVGPEDRYKGEAHTLHTTAGLIRKWSRAHVGLSVSYTHRTELLAYDTDNKERLYTYPMGYYIPMGDLFGDESGGIVTRSSLRSTAGNSTLFRSTGNKWQAALQAEWHGNNWSWFNELLASNQQQEDNPNESDNMRGWDGQFNSFRYYSRFSHSRGRWTHLLTPILSGQWGTSDRILQRVDESNITSAWITYATIRFASRNRADLSVQYELARDYTPSGSSLAWQASAGWQYQEEALYSYPYIVSQHTGIFRGEVAFERRLPLPSNSRLTLRPSIAIASGEGVEETIERTDNPAEAVMKSSRDYNRVSHDFAARTATRSHLCLQVEYRRPITRTLSAGIRLQAGVEQVWEQKREAQGQARACLIIWL